MKIEYKGKEAIFNDLVFIELLRALEVSESLMCLGSTSKQLLHKQLPKFYGLIPKEQIRLKKKLEYFKLSK